MSRYNGYEWYEWAALLVAVTCCLLAIMGACYAIFGPHYPPAPFNAKQEFVNQCDFRNGVPDVHTSNWVCADPEQ